MVTLSRLYLRGVRDGGSPGLTCSLPGQRRRAQPEPYVQPPYLGRYPGPAFPGLPTYFPTVSGWGGRGARRRAGLDRPPPLRGPGGVVPAEEPSGQDAAGAAEVAESISAALEGFEAGPCPAAPVGNAERPGRAPPEGGGFSRGPARPRGGSGCRLRLPLAFFHPNLSLPGRSPLPGRPMDVGAISAAPEREGMRGWWLSAGVSAGQAHASRSRSPTGAGCGLVFHSVRGGCLPRARCLTDPFLNSAGRAELQPLLTLHSN